MKHLLYLTLSFFLTTPVWSYETQLLELSNAARAKAGLPALCLSAPLQQAAQAHAQDMARNNYFSHIGRNGSDVGSRAQAAGYAYQFIGENIAAGYDNAPATFQTWMDSPAHQANILSPDFSEVGFAYMGHPDSDYQDYWVQVLGKPLSAQSADGSCGAERPHESLKRSHESTPRPHENTLSSRNAAPVITAITPAVLQPKPAGQRQWLTIAGQNFGKDARLELSVGSNTFRNRVPLSITPTELRYKINVGLMETEWQVRVSSGGQFSNPYRFKVSQNAASAPTPVANNTASSTADIAQCEQHFRAFHLTQGSGETALSCYQNILQREPNNQQAKFGLEKIEIYYFARIKAASDKGLWEEAQIYMNRLHRVNPNSPYLSVFAVSYPIATPNQPAPAAPTGIIENQQQTPYYALIKQAADTHRIPVAFIQSVIEVESSYDPNATSYAGAMGLMQLMPATAERFGVRNAYDPAQNINGGVTYLRQLWDLFDGNLELVLAAYNSGEGNVRKYGNTVPPSTRDYVTRIMNLYNERKRG